jgi:hypothetical protein
MTSPKKFAGNSDIGKRKNRINSKRVASVAEKGGAQLFIPFQLSLDPAPRGQS